MWVDLAKRANQNFGPITWIVEGAKKSPRYNSYNAQFFELIKLRCAETKGSVDEALAIAESPDLASLMKDRSESWVGVFKILSTAREGKKIQSLKYFVEDIRLNGKHYGYGMGIQLVYQPKRFEEVIFSCHCRNFKHCPLFSCS